MDIGWVEIKYKVEIGTFQRPRKIYLLKRNVGCVEFVFTLQWVLSAEETSESSSTSTSCIQIASSSIFTGRFNSTTWNCSKTNIFVLYIHRDSEIMTAILATRNFATGYIYQCYVYWYFTDICSAFILQFCVGQGFGTYKTTDHVSPFHNLMYVQRNMGSA